MTKPRRLLLCIILLLPVAAAADPLFDDADPLELTLEAPLRELLRHRKEKPEVEARVTWTEAGGTTRSVPARLATRGNARLETCDFPPLRLSFAPADVAGTPFAGQKDLKMVTHCRKGAKATGWLLQEYGIYVAFNAVTDASYRVRRLDVTYRDSESSRADFSSPAFFIEDTGRMAERLGKVVLRPPEVADGNFDPEALTRTMLFEYLIGNTDFAVRRGPAGEGCCHNGRVLAAPGSDTGWIVVPYDFDQSGLINTDYALPDERLGIAKVTMRRWRGFCWQKPWLTPVLAEFVAREDTLRALLLPAELGSSQRNRARGFLDRFFRLAGDRQELDDTFADQCRGAESFPVRQTRTQ